jgi:predicted RND superfamily exporter protein
MITFGGGIIIGIVVGMVATLFLLGAAMRSGADSAKEQHVEAMERLDRQIDLLEERNRATEYMVEAINNIAINVK